jgi:hypothetical protein
MPMAVLIGVPAMTLLLIYGIRKNEWITISVAALGLAAALSILIH